MITKQALEQIEFNKLLRVIAEFSHSEASRKSVLDIAPLDSKADIDRRFGQIHDMRRLSEEGTPLKLSPFSDLAGLIAKVRPEGAVLEAVELSGFLPVLSVLADLSLQLVGRTDLAFLHELTSHLTGFPHILKTLRRSIASDGRILDTASSMLSELRGKVRRLEGRIRQRLEEMVLDKGLSVFLQDDFITQRSGRWVIPVRMDSKGQVPGVVHDVSKSGETAFIEPLAVINLSNELENLIAEQKAEEIRILRNISSMIRNEAYELEQEYGTLVYLDVLYCIVALADHLEMNIPQISASGTISLMNARHPLLSLTLDKTSGARQVIPLDVHLGGDTTVMVITGSNAGGKTIAIKTIGLLLVMALAGMPVPADSSSTFPFVDHLLIDIGDEQSIENSLSTFSAHISHISEILKQADSRSLVLIDELGTGTDPDEGAALACAVLKEIRQSGSLVFSTTHLTDIKGFVYRTEGMTNASMEFDQKTLTPLYRLRMGEPGQSHALEVARKYGLPDSIIDSAKGLLGGIKVELDSLIADLTEKRAQHEKALSELERQHSETEQKKRQLEEMLSNAAAQKNEMLAKTYREALEIITETKRQMHALLDELKKQGRAKGREIIKQAEGAQELVAAKLREHDDYARTPSVDEIIEGDEVFVKSLGHDAPVLEVNLKNQRVKVQARGMEIELSMSDIEYKRGKSADSKKGVPDVGLLSEAREESLSSILNLVGLRVDEALSRLEPFLNHASLGGLSEVTVIHGIGKGLLLKAVREHVKGHPLVKNFRRGDLSEGGNGVTVIAMV